MKKHDLISRLYQHHEDYTQGRTQSIFHVACDCREAANEIVRLQALADNGQSALDTNKRLIKHIAQLQSELDVAFKTIRELALHSEDTCQYCKYDTPCKGDKCECFIEGVGMTDEQDKYYNIKWTCMDFNYGECPMLENTPCNECVQNDFGHFEWKGVT
jgi:hypothetical protein